jgi:hypothetical protein
LPKGQKDDKKGVVTLLRGQLWKPVTPGTFLYPGSDVHLQDALEKFGRSASAMVEVAE